MENPTPPIFAIEGNDVAIYESVQDLQSHLEPDFIAENVAYDAQGRLLRLEADRERVSVFLAEHEPTHAAELEAALREFLKWMKEPMADDPACDLPCLVQACRKFAHSVSFPSAKEVLLRLCHHLIRKFRK